MRTAVIIGSGFSGLCMGIKLKARNIHDFVILEKATELGGTWRENTYPGAECDIPSALYSYSFEPYPYWEYKWSHQPQILEYLKHCANKYHINRHIQFQKELVSASWHEDGYWIINTKDGDCYQSKTFIPAIGQLHHPSFPDIEGLEGFEGPMFHSANWDHSIDLEGRSIGVIGNAASAVQFIPQIAKEAKHVTIFQRSANWMLPKQDRLYKDWEKKLVKTFPLLLKIYRLRLWLLGGGLFFLMKSVNQLLRRFYERKCINYIRDHITDEQLVKTLTPSYPMGAKRILFSDDYYEALSRSNVTIVDDEIASIGKHGLMTNDGNDYKFDILVLSTGFKTNPFLLGLEIKGRSGVSINDEWKDGPVNYLGMAVSNFPNMFLMYGPNTNLGHNSIILMSEAQANYIAQCVEKLSTSKWKSLEIKKEKLLEYYSDIQKRLKKMIWSEIDNSWYQSKSGNIPNNWPGRTMEYIRKTKRVNFKDYLFDV